MKTLKSCHQGNNQIQAWLVSGKWKARVAYLYNESYNWLSEPASLASDEKQKSSGAKEEWRRALCIHPSKHLPTTYRPNTVPGVRKPTTKSTSPWPQAISETREVAEVPSEAWELWQGTQAVHVGIPGSNLCYKLSSGIMPPAVNAMNMRRLQCSPSCKTLASMSSRPTSKVPSKVVLTSQSCLLPNRLLRFQRPRPSVVTTQLLK